MAAGACSPPPQGWSCPGGHRGPFSILPAGPVSRHVLCWAAGGYSASPGSARVLWLGGHQVHVAAPCSRAEMGRRAVRAASRPRRGVVCLCTQCKLPRCQQVPDAYAKRARNCRRVSSRLSRSAPGAPLPPGRLTPSTSPSALPCLWLRQARRIPLPGHLHINQPLRSLITLIFCSEPPPVRHPGGDDAALANPAAAAAAGWGALLCTSSVLLSLCPSVPPSCSPGTLTVPRQPLPVPAPADCPGRVTDVLLPNRGDLHPVKTQ